MHAFDRQTDGRTNGRTNGQLCHRYTMQRGNKTDGQNNAANTYVQLDPLLTISLM